MCKIFGITFGLRQKYKTPPRKMAPYVKFSAEGTPYVDSAVSAISPEKLQSLIKKEMYQNKYISLKLAAAELVQVVTLLKVAKNPLVSDAEELLDRLEIACEYEYSALSSLP